MSRESPKKIGRGYERNFDVGHSEPALAVAGRGYLLQHGEIVAAGHIDELRDDRLMHELYLGHR